MKRTGWLILLIFFTACIKNPEKITVLSFNIRYDNPADGENRWSNRKPLVTDLVHSLLPDVIGMQEVTHNQLMDLSVMLPEYSWSGVGRDDGMTKGEYTAVFYKKNRFNLLDEATFWLSEIPEDTGSVSWGAQLPRIVTWIKLEDSHSDASFFVFNTHYSHISDSARTESSRLLVSKAMEIAGGYPVIVTGDFNFTNKAEGYRIITEQQQGQGMLFDAQYISQTPHFGGYSTFNGFGRIEDGEKIDFIFVNPSFSVIRHGIYPERQGDVFISDHYPVFAELEILDIPVKNDM